MENVWTECDVAASLAAAVSETNFVWFFSAK